jgi:hypothetical protein
VAPFLQAHPDMTLQHDNATSHTARTVCDCECSVMASEEPRSQSH